MARRDIEEISQDADMFVGIAVHEDDTPGEHGLFIVDHRINGFRQFDDVKSMAGYVVSEFGKRYAEHITYKPPIPPYDVFSAAQVDEFVLEVHREIER